MCGDKLKREEENAVLREVGLRSEEATWPVHVEIAAVKLTEHDYK